MSQVITQTEANDKTLLTYSALNTFRNCPRKYKNRYLDNLRPRERAEALSFGSVIHTAIELWYRSSDTELRLGEILAYLDDAFENRVVDPNQMVQWHLATAMMRGYATQLIDNLKFSISELAQGSIGVTVAERNLGAQLLFRKNGFRWFRTESHVVSRQDAYLMRWKRGI